MNYDPISSLESIGYVEREASFLYLVAVHSGYFLRRQYHRFAQREGGRLVARLLKKALRHQHIRVIECSQGRHIYHLAAKPVYDAFGCPDSQNRRIKGDASIKSRLMVLDFVLAHLDANLLSNEVGKVDFFTTQCGVRSELLPRSYVGRLMYFPDGFPILVSNAGVPRFTFFDEGQATATRFERFLKQYQPLFAALGEFELIFVADSDSNSVRAKDAFQRFLPTDRLRGVTPMTPLGVDHFLDYLAIKERSEAKGSGGPSRRSVHSARGRVHLHFARTSGSVLRVEDADHHCREDPATVSSEFAACHVHDRCASLSLPNLYVAAGGSSRRRQRDPGADPGRDAQGGGLIVKKQRVTRRSGVMDKYVPRWERPPVLRTCRVG